MVARVVRASHDARPRPEKNEQERESPWMTGETCVAHRTSERGALNRAQTLNNARMHGACMELQKSHECIPSFRVWGVFVCMLTVHAYAYFKCMRFMSKYMVHVGWMAHRYPLNFDVVRIRDGKECIRIYKLG